MTSVLVAGLAGLAFASPADAVPGSLVVSDQGAFGGPGGLIRVDRSTGARSTLSSNTAPSGFPEFVTPYRLATEADGDVLVAGVFTHGAGQSTTGIIRIDRETGERESLSLNGRPFSPDTLDLVRGVAVEPSGSIVITDGCGSSGGYGKIYRVDPQTGVRTRLSGISSPAGGPDMRCPRDIAVEPMGDILVTDALDDQVIRVDPGTGARTLVSSDTSPAGDPQFQHIEGLTIGNAGDPLLADSQRSAILDVERDTGRRAFVSANTAPAGDPTFDAPRDLAQFDGDGRLYVTSGHSHANPATTPRVISVRRSNGARRLLSDNLNPTGGPGLVHPYGIDVAPVPVTAVTIEAPRPGVRAARRTTGERVPTLRYTLDAAATMTVTVGRRVTGRIAGSRCISPARAWTGARRCTRWVTSRRFRVRSRAGANRVSLAGAARGQRPGTWTVVLTGRSGSGVHTVPVARSFTIR